jgi:hypothetical protein
MRSVLINSIELCLLFCIVVADVLCVINLCGSSVKL